VRDFYSLNLVLNFAVILFGIGMCGFLTRPLNIIFFLISNELGLLSFIFMFVSLGQFYVDLSGQLFVLVLLVISAIETALVLVLYISLVSITGERQTYLFDIVGNS